MEGEANGYDSVHRAVTDVVSGPQENIVLVYGNSSDNVYNAIAFQVVRSLRRIERVEDAFSLADDGTKPFGYFGENGFSADVSDAGDEVFRIEEDRATTVMEYGFAVPQDGVYVGVQSADDDAINGLRSGDERDRGFSADDLPNRGGVLSDLTYVDSPSTSLDFQIPTTALSEQPNQGFVRVDSRTNGTNPFYFAFNNQSGGQVTVDVVGYGQTYDVRPIQQENVVKQLVAGEGFDRRILTYGGFDNTKPNLPDGWYDYATSIDGSELTPGA